MRSLPPAGATVFIDAMIFFPQTRNDASKKISPLHHRDDAETTVMGHEQHTRGNDARAPLRRDATNSGKEKVMGNGNDTYTEVTSTGWFARIGNSLKGIGTGVVLIIAATALLWWNEGRAVRTGDAIAEARMVTEPLPDPDRVDSAADGKLVYARGRAVTRDDLTDPEFGITVNAIAMRRQVEYYQWVERSASETRTKPGGGEETVTTYTYAKEWAAAPVDSQRFRNAGGHENSVRLQTGDARWLAPHVTFGAYRLPEFLIRAIGGENALPLSLGDEQRAALQKALLAPDASRAASPDPDPRDDGMIHALGNTLYIGHHPGAPAIGDVRVRYFATPAADVSLIASVSGDTFVPFRASNGTSFSRLAMGARDMDAMFDDASDGNALMAWLLRIAGLLLCTAGFRGLLAPLRVLADVIPPLGVIVGAGTGLVAGLLGAAWSLVIIALAWLRFRPVTALCLLGAALALVILLYIRGRVRKAPPASA